MFRFVAVVVVVERTKQNLKQTDYFVILSECQIVKNVILLDVFFSLFCYLFFAQHPPHAVSHTLLHTGAHTQYSSSCKQSLFVSAISFPTEQFVFFSFHSQNFEFFTISLFFLFKSELVLILCNKNFYFSHYNFSFYFSLPRWGCCCCFVIFIFIFICRLFITTYESMELSNRCSFSSWRIDEIHLNYFCRFFSDCWDKCKIKYCKYCTKYLLRIKLHTNFFQWQRFVMKCV